MKSFASFTLVELIVVMAISGIMIALGVQAMLLIRQSVQFQQTESDFISNLRSVQNMARNSVASATLRSQGRSLPASMVDGYALVFDTTGSNYSLRHCFRQTSGGTPRMDCSGAESLNLKPNEYDDVVVVPLLQPKCRALFFERLTGKISAMNGQIAPLDNVGNCDYQVRHSYNNNLLRLISVDVRNGSITVQ